MTNRLVLLAKCTALLLATCAVTAPVRLTTHPEECAGAAAAASRRDSTDILSIEIDILAFRLDVRKRGIVRDAAPMFAHGSGLTVLTFLPV